MDPSEVRMNLASLQRIDPYIKTIALSASQVALYRYDNQEWIKTDSEGSLFVYERQFEPYHGFLILNRLSAENWVQPITSDMESQIQSPFLLYKAKESEIYGIWFYEENKCRIVGKAFEKYSKSNTKKVIKGKLDLSSLLNKAAGGTSFNATKSPKGDKLLRLLNDAQDKPENPESRNVVGASGSVMEFFAQASQVPPPPPPIRPVPVPIMNGIPAGMTLLPQQPGVTPILVPLVRPPLPNMQQPPPCVPPPAATAVQSLFGIPNAVSLESLERKHREETLTPPSVNFGGDSLVPRAVAVTDLESSLKKSLSISQGEGKTRPDLEDAPELLSPMVFSQPTLVHGGTASKQSKEVTPLTENQLAQAFEHLLKNDASFIGKLHQSYVESLNTKLSY